MCVWVCISVCKEPSKKRSWLDISCKYKYTYKRIYTPLAVQLIVCVFDGWGPPTDPVVFPRKFSSPLKALCPLSLDLYKIKDMFTG